MRVSINKIAIIILVCLIFILNKCKSNEISELKSDIHKSIIKNDKLRLDKDGIYKKYVSDSLTKKQLNKKVRDLEIKVKKPIIVEKIVFRNRDIKKTPDTVYIKKDTVKIVDYYPSKLNPFIQYIFNKEKDSVYSEFKFLKDVEINVVINETDLGVYESNIKAPDFIKISNVDINMLPNKKIDKVKNFGFILGAGYQKDKYKNSNLTLNTGIRYKKTYLQVQATTNQSIGISLSKEF